MTKRDKKELMQTYRDRIKTGIPINICTAAKAEQKEWLVSKILEAIEKTMEEQEPLGVVQGVDYDHCPTCNAIIGNSAYFCKRCGEYIRRVPDENR